MLLNETSIEAKCWDGNCKKGPVPGKPPSIGPLYLTYSVLLMRRPSCTGSLRCPPPRTPPGDKSRTHSNSEPARLSHPGSFSRRLPSRPFRLPGRRSCHRTASPMPPGILPASPPEARPFPVRNSCIASSSASGRSSCLASLPDDAQDGREPLVLRQTIHLLLPGHFLVLLVRLPDVL